MKYAYFYNLSNVVLLHDIPDRVIKSSSCLHISISVFRYVLFRCRYICGFFVSWYIIWELGISMNITVLHLSKSNNSLGLCDITIYHTCTQVHVYVRMQVNNKITNLCYVCLYVWQARAQDGAFSLNIYPNAKTWWTFYL